MEKELRIIISGGGTGGHIFPAVSIANAIKEQCPDAKILFVGAEGRMEMQRVPDAGYEIIGLPVAGFDRKRLWKNFAVLIKLARSQWKAKSIIKKFRPQVAVGVGGYASGPTLKMAGMMGVHFRYGANVYVADDGTLTLSATERNSVLGSSLATNDWIPAIVN